MNEAVWSVAQGDPPIHPDTDFWVGLTTAGADESDRAVLKGEPKGAGYERTLLPREALTFSQAGLIWVNTESIGFPESEGAWTRERGWFRAATYLRTAFLSRSEDGPPLLKVTLSFATRVTRSKATITFAAGALTLSALPDPH